jgi:hypothetical protein
LLRIEYRKNGKVAHVQQVTDERPGFIGTESLPGMGGGALVRHVKASYEGGRFALENRHGAVPLSWRAENGLHGELPPGEKLLVDGETDLLIGDWVITCHEE